MEVGRDTGDGVDGACVGDVGVVLGAQASNRLASKKIINQTADLLIGISSHNIYLMVLIDVSTYLTEFKTR